MRGWHAKYRARIQKLEAERDMWREKALAEPERLTREDIRALLRAASYAPLTVRQEAPTYKAVAKLRRLAEEDE